MRNITICLLFILAVLTAAVPSHAKGPKPGISFTEKTHDFGTINESDGKVTTEFEFTNNGNAPLVIISANASCGCTKPVIPDKPIAPGEKGSLSVSYNPAGRPGEFSKNITVRTNAPDSKKVILKISGVVIPSKGAETEPAQK